MKTLFAATALAAAVLVSALSATAPVLAAGERQAHAVRADIAAGRRPVLPLKDARLKIEFNATDLDAGVQLFVDSEPWKSLDVYDTRGRLIFRTTARGRLAKNGGTELFLESAEPTLDEVPLAVFFERFPQGDYKIVAEGLEGEKYVGLAKFTHNIPAGPVLVSPVEDEVVDPNNLVLRWQAVAPPNGSPIIGYQVLVVKPDSGLPALPKITLDVMMPPTATSLVVPPGFLLRDSAYEWEVLAIEAGGNQTLSAGHFRTPR